MKKKEIALILRHLRIIYRAVDNDFLFHGKISGISGLIKSRVFFRAERDIPKRVIFQ